MIVRKKFYGKNYTPDHHVIKGVPVVDVHDSEYLVRDGRGRCKCIICGTSFINHEKDRTRHLSGSTHRANVEKHRGTKK